jgi:hypothetical protein
MRQLCIVSIVKNSINCWTDRRLELGKRSILLEKRAISLEKRAISLEKGGYRSLTCPFGPLVVRSDKRRRGSLCWGKLRNLKIYTIFSGAMQSAVAAATGFLQHFSFMQGALHLSFASSLSTNTYNIAAIQGEMKDETAVHPWRSSNR